MKRAFLRRISVTTTSEAEDAVAELLGATLGLPASTYADRKTGVSTVTVYVRQKLRPPRKAREGIFAGLKRIKACGLNIGSGKIAVKPVRRENWAESWKWHFKPIEITQGRARRRLHVLPNSLLIKPSWSKRKPRKGQIVIVLDPGLSFGTGHHPTTAFCLGEILKYLASARNADSQVRANSPSANKTGFFIQTRTRGLGGLRSFLDLGTGSGILAMAAAKLGYLPVNALDADPEAIRVARGNARANRVHQKLKIRRGEVSKLPICPGQQRQRYDLVCANLNSNLLITERRRIAAQLNRAGTLVLAGILKPEFAGVQRAYESLGLKLVSRRSENEWRSGSFRFER